MTVQVEGREPVRVARPRSLLGGVLCLVERNAMVHRRMWLVIVSGLGEPVFYLLAMSVGVGRLIDTVPGPDGRPVSYTSFVGPGILAAAAMLGSLSESTFRLYRKIIDGHTYQAILATPVTVREVALGEVLWATGRGAIYVVGLSTMLGVAGVVEPVRLLPAALAALLVCVAFAAAGSAATSFMRAWQDHDLVGPVMMTMFLCSTTFFPLDAYPGAVRPLVQATPLYHGVSLVRGLAMGPVGPALLGYAAYLVVVAAIGARVAVRQLERRLAP
ncbi:MAG: ABC transporter permease [Acidimicrobiia bacterium]